MVVDDQDLVLEQADLVVAEVELEQTVAQQRMVEASAILPCALRLEVGIAARHPMDRQVPDADEIVEIELGYISADRELGVPSAARFPIHAQVGLEELKRPVGGRVAADRKV